MRRSLRLWLPPLAAVALLWALFLPSADLVRERFMLDWRPSALVLLLAAGLGALALGGMRLGSWARVALAVVILAASLLQAARALVLETLDRPLDLYFDTPHVPSLVGLAVAAAGPWRAAGAFALAALATASLLGAVAWSILAWQRLLAGRGRAVAALAIVAVALGLGGAQGLVSFAGTQAIADQGRRLARAGAVLTGFDHSYDAALRAPEPGGDLAALKGRDVLLVFVESYGTAVLDQPGLSAQVAPALAAFADTTRRAGYGMVSSRLVSPVFGGGSWLAHGTLESGLKLDPFLDQLLVTSRRATLARDLAVSGHRTLAVMPGMKTPWPESAFWGFQRTLFDHELGYGGPPFGWFDVPDQYTLARFTERELAPGHAPLFAEIVLVSSHTPFAPVPPYVADWRDDHPFRGVAQADWRRIYAEPDWAHLERPYLESVVYDLETLAGWLAALPGDGLVIILGDHQPPGIVSGATSPWTVPIHVLSRDPALIAPFLRQGYVEGAQPPQNTHIKGMESFLGDFLAGFSTAGS
jgi:hypothetical protein